MKEKCLNHPSKNVLSLCHSCGKYLCEYCLNAGEEYYYCKEEKCQLLLKEEKSRLQIIKKDSPEGTEEAKNPEVGDFRAAFVKAAKAARDANKAGNKEGFAKEKARMVEILISYRVRKIRVIRDAFGLTDTDMKKISWKNPALLSQPEFNLYLDDLKQRAFKLADNKFEQARRDLDKKSKEQLKATIKQKDEEIAGDIKEKRAAMKTIKELNKALNEKQWYRFLKILWLISYLVFLVVVMKRMTIISFNSFMGASIVFSIFTLSFLGATAALKRVAIYTLDYISNGKILLKEKRYSLLLIVLWGILSIVILFVIDDFNKVIALNLNYARDYFNRGYTYYRKKQYDRAIEDYTKAIAIDPNYAFAYSSRADAYVDKKQYDRAIEDYTKLIALDPNKASAYSSRADAYYKKGNIGNMGRAIEDYTKAIALEKFDYLRSAYYSHRGFIYYLTKQYDRAIEDYSAVIEFGYHIAYAYSMRGDVYAGKKQYDRAIKDYTKAIALDPNDAFDYSGRGDAYYKKGNRGKAISDFQKACDMGNWIGCTGLKKALEKK